MTYCMQPTEQTPGFLICLPKPEEIAEPDFVGMDDWTFQVRYTYLLQRLVDASAPFSLPLSKLVIPSRLCLKIFQ